MNWELFWFWFAVGSFPGAIVLLASTPSYLKSRRKFKEKGKRIEDLFREMHALPEPVTATPEELSKMSPDERAALIKAWNDSLDEYKERIAAGIARMKQE